MRTKIIIEKKSINGAHYADVTFRIALRDTYKLLQAQNYLNKHIPVELQGRVTIEENTEIEVHAEMKAYDVKIITLPAIQLEEVTRGFKKLYKNLQQKKEEKWDGRHEILF